MLLKSDGDKSGEGIFASIAKEVNAEVSQLRN